MKVRWSLLVAAFVFAAVSYARPQLISEARSREVAKPLSGYDGKWWVAADDYEREGFFWGTSDCLTWTAHVGKGFYGTSTGMNADAFTRKVSDYYRAHPSHITVPVISVWRKLGPEIGKATPQTEGGEVYKTPHGFLDDGWYKSSSEAERFGFLEGYLGCLRTYVKDQEYSRPVHEYDDKIWDYYASHPKSYHEAIADVLFRFRDRPKAN